MMTCTPLSTPEDLKVLIREGITKICPPDQVKPSYETLRFFLSPGDPGTSGLHLLVGLHIRSEVHMKLRDILLCQPDYLYEGPRAISPWLEPPYAAPSAQPGLGAPPQQPTAVGTAELLKARFRPTPHRG